MIRRKDRARVGARKVSLELGIEGIIGRATGIVACHGKTDKGVQVCLGDIYDVSHTRIHVDGSSDDCVVSLSSLKSTSNLLNELCNLSSGSSSSCGNRAPCTTPEPAALKHIIDLSLMDKRIEKLAMTSQHKGETMSPHELYSRSNPGLCGQGIDYTDPRSWYDSKEAKKLLHSFVKKYNSQLSKPGYNDHRALAKFIVDLPQNIADSSDLGRYTSRVDILQPSRTTRTRGNTEREDGERVLHVNNLPNTPPTGQGRPAANHSHGYLGQSTESRKDADARTLPVSNQMNADDGERFVRRTAAVENRIQITDENNLQKIGDHVQLKLERKLHIPLPPIFLPKVTSEEMVAAERENSEKSWEGRRHLPSTHTDVCFLDHKQKYSDLRLPRHETDVRQVETYKETYLLRQKSLLKLKTFSEEQQLKTRHKHRRSTVKKSDDRNARATNRDPCSDPDNPRRTKFTGDDLSIVNSTSTSSCDAMMPLSRGYDGDTSFKSHVFGSHAKEEAAEPENTRTTEPWPYKKSGTKFLYKCPSDGFLNRTMTEMKREKTTVINLDLHGDELTRGDASNHCAAASVSNSLQRFLLSRGYPAQNEPSAGQESVAAAASNAPDFEPTLSRVQERRKSVEDPEEERPGKQRRGYLRKFKRIQVFGESRRPDTSHQGKIRWEDPDAARVLPVLRPPENYKMDLNPQTDFWRDADAEKPAKPRVTTEHTTLGKTTILIDAPVSGYRKWQRGQVTRPLRIEVTFGKGNKTTGHSAAKRDAKRDNKADKNKDKDGKRSQKQTRQDDGQTNGSGSDTSRVRHASDDLRQADITEAGDMERELCGSADRKDIVLDH